MLVDNVTFSVLMMDEGWSSHTTPHTLTRFSAATPLASATMGRKGKKNKHTAKEIQRKIDAHKDKGGGKAGLLKRRTGHAQVQCKMCMKMVPSIASLQEHFDRYATLLLLSVLCSCAVPRLMLGQPRPAAPLTRPGGLFSPAANMLS